MVKNQKMLNKKKCDFLVVGAGLAGVVMAERIASQLDKKVLIIDKRPQVGGNCYDFKDKNGILIQKYGPHIFHTNDKKVFDYLSKFTQWHNYKHRVLALYSGNYYLMPVNLTTLNSFYKVNLTGRKQVEAFLKKRKLMLSRAGKSSRVCSYGLGDELYKAFIKNYTQKQWGMPGEDLDSSIFKRVPLRHDKEEAYFKDKYQGLPKLGYSHMINNMLKGKNITTMFNVDFFKIADKLKYKKLIYTGPIDKFFGYKFGKLQYRSIRFVFETHNLESSQPNSVINFPELRIPYTRITEFNKFYSKRSDRTVICKEFPGWDGEPAYPVINKRNINLLKRYTKEAKKLKQTVFIGRLAQYRYLDMDEIIKEALNVFQ